MSDSAGHINFTKTWAEYKNGFGSLSSEFWYGNEFIHLLTANTSATLRVDLVAHDGTTAYAQYDEFRWNKYQKFYWQTTFLCRIDGEESDYRLWVSGYSGNASDSLSAHNGYKFSTVDRNNDRAPKCCPCAPAYGGGWWFYR